jgi:FkbM family methyltransferase
MTRRLFKQVTKDLVAKAGLAIVNKELHDQAIEKAGTFESLIRTRPICDWENIRILEHLNAAQRQAVYPYLLLSKSQLAQDLFVVSRSIEPSFPRFFVEFGATDGIKLSNTYLLEKYLGWDGILAEPAKTWHRDLRLNRNCIISFDCVSSESNQLVDFIEATSDPADPIASAELSSMATFAESLDDHRERRLRNAKTYQVQTISLNDLLLKHSAPSDIGYLSIDTEGSELSIIETIDFTRYRFRLITVEHNHVEPNRTAIRELLTSKNYRQVYEDISQWDDWYVLCKQD